MLLELMHKPKALSECTEEALAVGRCGKLEQFSCAACVPLESSNPECPGLHVKDGGFGGGSVLIPHGPVLKTVLAYCIMMA